MPDRSSTVQKSDSRSWLIALAAKREFEAACCACGVQWDTDTSVAIEPWSLLSPGNGVDLLYTGVGKSSAAGAVARVLDPKIHKGVISAGIAGALPGGACQIGDVVCATSSIFADEGVQTPNGFESCAQMGFAPFPNATDGYQHDQHVVDWISAYGHHSGPIACVSVCSGTDECARRVVDQTGAIAEAMEGAAVVLSAQRVDPALLTGELRVISNTTGDRSAQKWALDDALSVLESVLGRLSADLG